MLRERWAVVSIVCFFFLNEKAASLHYRALICDHCRLLVNQSKYIRDDVGISSRLFLFTVNKQSLEREGRNLTGGVLTGEIRWPTQMSTKMNLIFTWLLVNIIFVAFAFSPHSLIIKSFPQQHSPPAILLEAKKKKKDEAYAFWLH